MVERISTEFRIEQPVDDLKQVNGIGPVVEKRLHQAGISSYARLAATEPQELADLLTGLVGLTPERIITQDWIGQAHKLAADTGPFLQEVPGIEMDNRLHYASYTVEFLLDQDNRVRRTRATHVQTQKNMAWAGWDEHMLGSFLVESAGLRIEAASPGQPETVEATTQMTEFETAGERQPVKPVPEPPANLRVPLEIQAIQLWSLEGEPLERMLTDHQPFNMRIALDLSRTEIPAGESLEYEASLYATELGSRVRQLAGCSEGLIAAAEAITIDFQSRALAPGEYRLEALVELRPRRTQEHFLAFREEMPLHIC